MKALAIRRYRAPMELMELPRPEPGPGELLVRVRAAGVNPLDYKIRDGAVKVLLTFSFPLVLGTDLAGDVEAIGPGVTRFKIGDAVYSRLDNAQAASLPLVGLTVWQALIELARLRAWWPVFRLIPWRRQRSANDAGGRSASSTKRWRWYLGDVALQGIGASSEAPRSSECHPPGENNLSPIS